jgi:hypothetical protein
MMPNSRKRARSLYRNSLVFSLVSNICYQSYCPRKREMRVAQIAVSRVVNVMVENITL